ncbi:MAG: DEAD/DEAH box helicase family protein [Acidobacteria bacterium]|nr:DEAD/DEAH box helicase family protein [Acidobacteriota bacterium]
MAELRDRLARKEPELLAAVLPALTAYPGDGNLILMAAVAALLDNKPAQSQIYIQRFRKRFVPFEHEDKLLNAIALAQQGRWIQARQIIEKYGEGEINRSFIHLPGAWNLRVFFLGWTRKIEREAKRQTAAALKDGQRKRGKTARPEIAKKEESKPVAESVGAIEIPPLPRYEMRIPVKLNLPENLLASIAAETENDGSIEAFRLRYELGQLSLLKGFDELLCLPTLRGVETFWYQTEAVRKVLKQFRGRVLLADEVGLGKTIEAGMVLKEYVLRGMARKILILTPATLVGQWREEMAVKFELDFATSYDALLRQDAERFWAQPRVIASIAAARRSEHSSFLARQNYDLVVVDEAHHLKNRRTANWNLVNSLTKRFLLLLSATPVQNSLVELYNLLTLLKPGIFKTEKEFRTRFMTGGKSRVPANREKMRELMRDVMIRNTRSLVDVRLPPRHAATLKLEPTAEEAECYGELNRLIRLASIGAPGNVRLSLRHLLSAAGSTAATAAASINRFVENKRAGKDWKKLAGRYAAIERTAKEKSLLDLLLRSPEEKKMVFVHHRTTLERLADLAQAENIPFAVFEGSMSGPEKDRAVELFRTEVPILLCTESGGEGRNLQFCRTLINFDLPWNPMSIEQRIGRLHRIGQTREVFVFNLAAHGTLEDHILRILDEKINMFELVVGEIDAILGEMDEEQDFSELVFDAWLEAADREQAFEELGARLLAAKKTIHGSQGARRRIVRRRIHCRITEDLPEGVVLFDSERRDDLVSLKTHLKL